MRTEDIIVIETNIDDMLPEDMGFIMEKLFEMKALDVWFTPIYMKKNRPAVKLSALIKQDDLSDFSEYILNETSSIGLRFYEVQRVSLDRTLTSVLTEYGEVKAKIVQRPSGPSISPEYESLKLISIESGLPIEKIRKSFTLAAEKILKSD